jgi:hypothetical protein
MNSLFLSGEQLRELTGYVQPAAQIRWLRKNAVHHFVRADGRPRVPLAAIAPAPAKAEAPRKGPNFDALPPTH